MFGTLAAYELQRLDVVVPDPNNFLFNLQVGEQRSRGLELELNGQAGPRTEIVANYSLIDAVVTNDPNADFLGDRLSGVAKHSAGIYSSYQFGRGLFRNFLIGVGLYTQSNSQPALPNRTWTLPGFARIDANFGYRREDWRFNVAVKNLNDRHYFETGGFGSIMPQASRHLVASFSYTIR